MTCLEHYFENLLFDGKDIVGDYNKNNLSKEEQNAVEECATYVLCTLFPDRKNIRKVLEDLKVLEILKKHIELEKEDSDPYDECAFYEDVLHMNLNLEQDVTSDEYEKINQWLEE